MGPGNGEMEPIDIRDEIVWQATPVDSSKPAAQPSMESETASCDLVAEGLSGDAQPEP